MVLKYNTNKDSIILARNSLLNMDVNIIGIILNGLRKPKLFGTRYKYSYGASYRNPLGFKKIAEY